MASSWVMMTDVAHPPTQGERADDAVEPDPLRALYESHAAAMLRLATALLGDAAAAEDVVQDAFVSIDRSLRTIPAGARVAYLRTAVMNGARSSIRRSRATKRQPIPQRDDVPSLDESAVRHDQQERVIRALDALPFRQRQCLVLRYYGGLADREVAETLGISLGSAKTHLRRGLDALHETLGDLR
jgi:RNA polymerase sigma-70 factor (sigma-E family)